MEEEKLIDDNEESIYQRLHRAMIYEELELTKKLKTNMFLSGTMLVFFISVHFIFPELCHCSELFCMPKIFYLFTSLGIIFCNTYFLFCVFVLRRGGEL